MKIDNRDRAIFKSTQPFFEEEQLGVTPITVRRIPKDELSMFLEWSSASCPIIRIVNPGDGDSFDRVVVRVIDISKMFPEISEDRVYKITW